MLNVKKILGQNLKEIRLNLNLNQEDFAARFGSDAKTVSRIETGRTFATAETLSDICKAFKISPQELFRLNNAIFEQNLEKDELIDIFIMLLKNQDNETIESLLQINKTILDNFDKSK